MSATEAGTSLDLSRVEPVARGRRRIRQDVRYASRLLGRNPGFAAVAIVSLALGIGANSAVFSLLNTVALRDLDVRRPDQLVALSAIQRNGNTGPLSFPMFEAIARYQQVS